VDLLGIGPLSFEAIAPVRYPLWQLREHLLAPPRLGGVLNAANEAAIEKFRRGECDYSGFCDTILDAYRRFEDAEPTNLEEIFEIDREVRHYVG
jgi:1-deoxy-D-xylulose-5-phosphate reductoisomerase